MKNFVLSLCLILVTSCSSAQKTEEKVALSCVGNEAVALIQAVQTGNVGALTQDLFDCAKAALASAKAGSGSGSAL